jgi:hypothetical protein
MLDGSRPLERFRLNIPPPGSAPPRISDASRHAPGVDGDVGSGSSLAVEMTAKGRQETQVKSLERIFDL